MSFGLYRQITTSVDGDAAEFGANDISIINKLLNGVTTAVPAVKIASNNGFYFTDAVLRFLNTAQDKQITIKNADVANNYNLQLPLLIANDEMAVLNLAQTFKNKILDNTNNISAAIPTTLAGMTLTTPIVNGMKGGDVGITNVNSPYTAPVTVRTIRANASGGPIVINLPTAVGNAGLEYHIFRTDVALSTNVITIDPAGAETINSNAIYLLYPAEWVKLESDGSNWQLVGNTSPSQPGYYFLKGATANRRYIAGFQDSTTPLIISTTSPVANTLWALPLIVSLTTKFDIISFHITTVSTAGNSRVGVYRDNGNDYPGALLFDSGAIVTTATGQKDATITASVQIFQPGLYWLVYEQDTSTGQMVVLPSVAASMNIMGLSGLQTTAPGWMYAIAHTFGALPNPFTAGQALSATVPSVSTPVPAVGLRPV